MFSYILFTDGQIQWPTNHSTRNKDLMIYGCTIRMLQPFAWFCLVKLLQFNLLLYFLFSVSVLFCLIKNTTHICIYHSITFHDNMISGFTLVKKSWMNQENTYSKGCEVKYLLKSKTGVDLFDFNSQSPF